MKGKAPESLGGNTVWFCLPPWYHHGAMILLNPKVHRRDYPDARSREVMLKTIDFFERKGKARIKEDYHATVWYSDFLDFVAEEQIFATMCTPQGYGAEHSRWDTWRVCGSPRS